MDCLSDERVLGFVRGEVPDTEREAIETHLDGCESCFKLVGTAMRLAGEGDAAGAQSGGTAGSEAPGTDGQSTANDGLDSEDSLMPSAISEGRYVVRDLLGQGGAGAVYRAFDSQLGRQIALKIVRAPKLAAGAAESMQARLLREARAMARVSHPNVVAVYDVGTIGDRVFVVMELVEGRTLASWHREKTRGWREVVETFMAAGVGLAAAHRVGLVHRDFKPLNVLVGLDGRVRVTDFGLARPVAQADSGEATPSGDSLPEGHSEWTLTMTGGLVGTPRYMAPEQFRSGPADERTDQFSFCVALFTALYGRHPFFPEGTKKPPLPELAELVMAGQLVAPADTEGIPPGLMEVLTRGLSANPAQRYPSMDLLIADLSKFIAPAGAARRSVLRTTVLGLLGVAVLGGALFALRSEGASQAGSPVASEPPATASALSAAAAPLGSEASAPAATNQTAAAPSVTPLPASKPRPVSRLPPARRKPSAPSNPDRLKNPF